MKRRSFFASVLAALPFIGSRTEPAEAEWTYEKHDPLECMIKWIDVKDRLPVIESFPAEWRQRKGELRDPSWRESCRVLLSTCGASVYVEIGRLVCYQDGRRICWVTSVGSCGVVNSPKKVTHWAELPNPVNTDLDWS